VAGEIFGSRLLQVNVTGDDVVELQIRLAGFKNAGSPNGIFSSKTKSQVMSFQKDYMDITPSGIVDKQTFDATDTFAAEFNFDSLQSIAHPNLPTGNNWTTKGKFKCPCSDTPDVGCQSTNSGFGHNDNTDVYKSGKGKYEKYHKKEYLGIHRMLLWAVRAVLFYHPQYTWTINSGYRCRNDNVRAGRTSTNHMGKAVDLAPGLGTQCNDARRRIVQKMAAQIAWNGSNQKSLEPSNIAPTWVHFDVRSFAPEYLTSTFFATSETTLNNQVTHTLTENSEEVSEEPLFEAQEEIISNQNSRQYDVDPSSEDGVKQIVEDSFDDLASGIYNYVTNTDNFQITGITTGTVLTPAPVTFPLTDNLAPLLYFNSEQMLRDNLKSLTYTGLPGGGIANMFVAINAWLAAPVVTIGLKPDPTNVGTVLIDTLTPPDTGVTGLHGTIIFPAVINMGTACQNELASTTLPEDPKENRIKTWEIINKYIKMAININVIPPIPTVGTAPVGSVYTGVTTVTLVWTDEPKPAPKTQVNDGSGIPIGEAAVVILSNVPDYTLVFNTVTGLFARSLPNLANPDSASTVTNSLGNKISTDSVVNANLILSADDALAAEVPATVTGQVGTDEETLDYTGGEGLNELVTAMTDFGEFMANNIDDINTTVGEENMQAKIVLTVMAPVVKTTYSPVEKVKKDGVVTR